MLAFDMLPRSARRWVVKSTIAWLKGFRVLHTHYTRLGAHFLALVHLALYADPPMQAT